eukprot:PhF_6_TR34212/c0_g1_i1/m.50164/K04077/groEL, HSPD1; chaperonin GroEL
MSGIPTSWIAKELRFGVDARQAMLRGVERITRAVAVTLGPKGRNVVIDSPEPQDAPKVTKDGVTVAKNIAFADPFENIGAKLIRHASSRTNDVAGDGTTTTSVLTWSIFAEGYKSVATGTNPMDLKRGIDRAVDVVTTNLKSQVRSISSESELKSVATISANGDAVIGALVATAVHSTGNDGVVRIVETNAAETTLEISNGLLLPSTGFLTSNFVTDIAQQRVAYNRPVYVFTSEVPVESFDVILPALQKAHQMKGALIVIAPKISGVALEALLLNNSQGNVPCCAVELSDTESLQDIPCFLGADSVATGAAVDQSSTLLFSPSTPSPKIADRAKYLRSCLERIQGAESTDALRQRLANLVSKTAVVRVGGTTDVDCSERKDRVIDAVCATRAALREGIVAGGGSALLYASTALDNLRGENDDQNTGIQIVRNAIRLPCELIANNAGLQGGVIAQKILQKNNACYGFDAQRDRYVDMFEAGIVDPLLVVRTCLSDASSVAGLMLTTEATVCADLYSGYDESRKKSQITFPLNNVAAGLEGILHN